MMLRMTIGEKHFSMKHFMLQNHFYFYGAMLAVLAATGCGSRLSSSHRGYETIGKDPRRDTELAKLDNSKGVELIKKKKYADAEKVLKEALDADVTYGPAHNSLGNAYFQNHELYLAAWEFQYATKLMPDVPEPRNNLGLVLEAVGKLDDAVTCYDDALKLGPDNPQFLGNAARARFRRGDRDDHLRGLLESVVQRDSRTDWTEWAKEQLILIGPGPATKPEVSP